MYFDTGILIKLLTAEKESAWFEKAIVGHSMTSSELAMLEVKAALFSKERASVISARLRKAAESQFTAMIEDDLLQIVPMDSAVFKRAARVIEACHPSVPLRSLDALHIASCDLAQDFPLCTTDARMHAAARAFHIPVFPETLPLAI